MISKAKYSLLKNVPRLPDYIPVKAVMHKSKLSGEDFATLVKKVLDEKYILMQGTGADARISLRDKGWDAVNEYRFNPRTLSLAALILGAAALIVSIVTLIIK